jgi:hypothetical protein
LTRFAPPIGHRWQCAAYVCQCMKEMSIQLQRAHSRERAFDGNRRNGASDVFFPWSDEDGDSQFLRHVTNLLALEVSRPARRGDVLLCLRPTSTGLPLRAWQMLQIGEDEREQLGMIREVQEGAVILCVPLLRDYSPGDRVIRYPQPSTPA